MVVVQLPPLSVLAEAGGSSVLRGDMIYVKSVATGNYAMRGASSRPVHDASEDMICGGTQHWERLAKAPAKGMARGVIPHRGVDCHGEVTSQAVCTAQDGVAVAPVADRAIVSISYLDECHSSKDTRCALCRICIVSRKKNRRR